MRKVPHLQRLQEFGALLPVPLHQGLGGRHDKVTGLLGGPGEDLTVVDVIVLAERPRNDPRSTRVGVPVYTRGSHVEHLQNHGADQMASL